MIASQLAQTIVARVGALRVRVRFRRRAIVAGVRDARRAAIRALVGNHEVLALLVGGGMVAYGAHAVYTPAGWIAGGFATIAFFGPFGGPGDGGVPA